MKKQFVTYEIASKLKELGFDEECLTSYKSNKTLFKIWYNEVVEGKTTCSAPLWQQTEDWLRNKNIIIEVRKNFPKNQYFYTIDSKTFQYVSESTFSYFEAREQAILKCIELCQNEK